MAQTTQQIINFINSTSQPNSITGQILAEALNGLIAKSSYAGVAKLATDPGTPEGGAFYIAGEVGTFSHFNNAIVKAGELAVFVYNNGSWLKESVDVASNLGSPDDTANAEGSAFARIKKVVDDIGKINTTLTTISQSVQRNYHLALVNALTVYSGTDLVKLAFTPVGEEEPAAPRIGDVLSGKLNTADRLTQFAIIESISQNTVGAPVVTIKYSIDDITTTLSVNTQTWSITDKEEEHEELSFDWFVDGFSGYAPYNLFIRTNKPIPNGWSLEIFWRSKNPVQREDSDGDVNKHYKGRRWTHPQCIVFSTKATPESLPTGAETVQSIDVKSIPCTFERFDVMTKSYIYSTGMRAVDIAKPFICIDDRITEGEAYAVKLCGGGGKVIISNNSDFAKMARLKLGFAFRTGNVNRGLADELSNMIRINILFTLGQGGIQTIFPPVNSMDDLAIGVTFERP